jgi:hypothetical protein
LRPVLEGQANFTRTFWMSMPAETKHLARMQTVWNFLRETAEAQRGLLLLPTGSAGLPSSPAAHRSSRRAPARPP